ncbi:hypothetical protein O181_056836 [Austropuccinia psidii MF-1]|uniref:Uncharacterized protein n=1 Tax=Austropuccinia psidii MF-1 TaxID=1389203 RepID=A0A9Q3HTD1_9BASI|nr:hypothetical protein [Austropuccinia psidii MF-1]
MIHGPRSVGQLHPFWPDPMRPKGAKGGSQVGPKPQSEPPEPKLVINPLDPKLAKDLLDTNLAMEHHGPMSQSCPLATTRSAQSAFPSTYGESFPFLYTIRT